MTETFPFNAAFLFFSRLPLIGHCARMRWRVRTVRRLTHRYLPGQKVLPVTLGRYSFLSH